MRTLAVVLLLSVPLSAGDKSSLANAVALFKSPHAAQREAGSQLADRELRRLLAPLLEAMKDNDPEARRRARRSILSLVPGEAEKDGKPVTVSVIGLRGGVGGGFRGRRGFRALKLVQARPQALQPSQKQRADLTRKGTRLLDGLGIRWKTQWRAPLMPGFRVLDVQKESPATRMGLRTGDLIVRINGEEVARVHDVPRALGDKPDWSRITVTVLRNGKYVRLPKERAGVR
ncbi:MAG: PDZ domain-containing protein [Planctomycetota bacterium]|jgi:membrane-associated protease RseP (regulator of RpoE activity)